MTPILGTIASSFLQSVGAFESIQTINGNGSSSTITFNTISSNYRHLQVRGIIRGTRSFNTEQIYARLNGDAGNNYAYHSIYGSQNGGQQSNASNTNTHFFGEFPAATSPANCCAAFVLDILDVKSSSKNKTLRAICGWDSNAGAGSSNKSTWLSSGLWMNVSAVTSLTILSNGPFTTTSTIALYGIRDL